MGSWLPLATVFWSVTVSASDRTMSDNKLSLLEEYGMKYAVNSSEMKIYDRNTSEYFGVPGIVLMERASLSVTRHVLEWIKSRNVGRKHRALVMCGVGNNGGDGACIGRLLKQQDIAVTLCVVGDYTKCTDLLLEELRILGKYGITPDTFCNIRDNKSAADFDIIIDALFGVGLSRPLSGDFANAVAYINSCKKERAEDMLVLSIDVPSGVDADNGRIMNTAVKADVTVTFNQTKLGHIMYPGCEYTGKIFVEDVGITNDSFLGKEPGAFFYDEDVHKLIPERDKASNKGSNGKVLVIAGSKNVSGACFLAASAALKTGAGMVKIFTAAENVEAIKTLLPEALLDTYEDDENFRDRLEDDFNWSTAAVLGPGIGMDRTARELVDITLSEYNKNLIVDADAINLIAADEGLKALCSNYSTGGKKLILTPHLAEFSRIYGEEIKKCKENILTYPKLLADKMHCTVVCKDARTIVADSSLKKIYINVSGNDGMATAGSGDVLAGIMGAMLCLQLSSMDMASIGVYLHGLAGDHAAGEKGKYSMIASDIIDGIVKYTNV